MKNKIETVVVVGASRGIGLGFVEKFLALDCKVIATYRAGRNEANLKEIKTHYGDKLVLSPLDLNDEKQIEAFAMNLHDKIDLLILSAGTTGNDNVLKLEPKPLDPKTFWPEYNQSMSVHVKGPLQLLLNLGDKLQNKNTCIVYLTTPHGIGSKTVGIDAHSISKAAGQAMIYNRCKEMVENWVIQNNEPEQLAQAPGAFAIYPGWVKTDMGGEGRLTVKQSVDKMLEVIKTVMSNKKFYGIYSYNGSVMNPGAYMPSETLIKVIAAAEKENQKSETKTGEQKKELAISSNLPFFKNEKEVPTNSTYISVNALI